MTQKITVVDAFTKTPFSGNPAAVCILPEPREDTWMQAVAREMNLSETAFLLAGEEEYSLRWFTPVREVDLCGHATLASSHVLWEEGHLSPEDLARFQTRSGPLTALRQGDWIEMDFPATPAATTDIPPRLPEILGADPVWVGRTKFDFLVRLGTEREVRDLRPGFDSMRELSERGFLVTAPGEGEYDFVSRCFFPRYGIDEDPVTGSAHCALGPFWAEDLGKSELTAYQASARGGTVRVRVKGERVALGGQAVTVWRGGLV